MVPGFDPQFNAITGLNGSGKSNILDSICFVLGITNLTQVRAGNLQELVYKQGQAGVSKASVSITFNNSDRANSPVGYEHCDTITVTRQVVIGGRNKYLINGSTAQPSRVQNLFHSVQLNVNNPHFLIMQGRITKVLNMKPHEILGMLEEAGGTRMYETKKEGALKTLTKKEAKVAEIDKVLEEEIMPALEKLRKERAAYMEWSSQNATLERLRRFCAAYQFVQAEREQEACAEGIEENQRLLESLRREAEDYQGVAADKDDDVERLASERAAQMGDDIKALSEKEAKLSKELVKLTTAYTNQQSNAAAEHKAVEAACADVPLAEAAIEEARQIAASAEERAEEASKEATRVQQAAESVEAERTGMVADAASGTQRTLGEALAEAKAAAKGADSEAKQLETKAKHLEKEVAAKSKAIDKMSAAKNKAAKERDAVAKAITDAKTKLQSIGYDAEAAAKLFEETGANKAAVRELSMKCQKIKAGLQRLDFKFSAPEKNFDMSRVKGMVAKLVQVKDTAASTALEVIAGAKLFNVVVDSDKTGKALLAKGQLKHRVTLIPLNKIDGNAASAAQQAAAKQLSGGKANLSLDLVGYDAEVEAAIRYVFGKSFVCRDSATAQKVAFAPNVRAVCVTLEGDVFNPSGTLTGGSRSNQGGTLAALHALATTEDELAAVQARLDENVAADKANAKAKAASKDALRALEVAEHKASLMAEREKNSELGQLAEARDALAAEAEAARVAAGEARDAAQEAAARAKELEAQHKEFEKGAKADDASHKKKVKAARDAASKAATAAKKAATDAQKKRLAVDAAVEQLTAAEENVGKAQAAAEAADVDLATAEGEVARVTGEYEVVRGALDERKERAAACDSAIAAAKKEANAARKRVEKAKLETKKAERKAEKLVREANDGAGAAEALLKANPWLESERSLFGKPGTEYDFEAEDPEEALDQLEAAQEKLKSLGKNVNRKVMAMFDKAESEYRDLSEKKAILLNDKAKIMGAITELDEKKKKALYTTWQKVTKDFGSIFSTLLPGTTAKLDEPEDGDYTDGLEVKVAFGGVWKQSLTELSGGQRSLLALSLILALLLFKPAPVYILDEVDAALDLNHTQNIGRMIKAHFPHSQFIVVSLKEGMFSNANVIYRTRFIEGVSTVTRTVPEGSGAAEGVSKGKGGKGKAAAVDAAGLKENTRPAGRAR